MNAAPILQAGNMGIQLFFRKELTYVPSSWKGLSKSDIVRLEDDRAQRSEFQFRKVAQVPLEIQSYDERSKRSRDEGSEDCVGEQSLSSPRHEAFIYHEKLS